MKLINKNTTVGFAEKFYTLWVVETFKKKEVSDGLLLGWQYIQKFTYLQNLSFNEEEALKKAHLLTGSKDITLDTSLRGTSTFEVQGEVEVAWSPDIVKVLDWTKTPSLRHSYVEYGYDMLKLGATVDPLDKTSTWVDDVRPLGSEFYRRETQVWRDTQKLWAIYNYFTKDAYLQGYDKEGGFNVFNQPGTFLYWEKHNPSKTLRDRHDSYVRSPNPRHAVIARRRLVELGELIKFEGKYISMDDYCTEMKKRDPENRYHFEQGQRVSLELTLERVSGYESFYGYNTIQFFKDQEGREFLYSGTSPKDLEVGEKYIVTGTVKHQEYRDTKQTLLTRMKIN